MKRKCSMTEKIMSSAQISQSPMASSSVNCHLQVTASIGPAFSRCPTFQDPIMCFILPANKMWVRKSDTTSCMWNNIFQNSIFTVGGYNMGFLRSSSLREDRRPCISNFRSSVSSSFRLEEKLLHVCVIYATYCMFMCSSRTF